MKQAVFEALRNAIENGYDGLKEWSAEDLAADLIAYADDFFDVSVDDLVPLTTEWLELIKVYPNGIYPH